MINSIPDGNTHVVIERNRTPVKVDERKLTSRSAVVVFLCWGQVTSLTCFQNIPAQLILFVIHHWISAVKLQRTLQGSGFPMETPVQNTSTPFKIIKTRHKCTMITTSTSTKIVVITILIKTIFSHLCSLNPEVSHDVTHHIHKCKRVISDRHLIGQLRSGASRREKGRCSSLSARGATSLGEISASCTDEQ